MDTIITESEKRRLLDHIEDTGNPHRRPELFISASASLSFGSIASNGVGTLTLSVTGAVTGKPVILGAPSAIEAGLTWSGYVSAPDTVTVRVHNGSGGSVAPATATWTVMVSI